MKNFLQDVSFRRYSTFVALIVIFVHKYVLDRNMQCTCTDEDVISCSLYLGIPFFILFLLQLWTDEKFTRLCKYSCGCLCGPECECNPKTRFCMVLLYHIMKAFCIGLLWILAVLFDGDWYVCCVEAYSGSHFGLACKTEKRHKDRELTARLTNVSMVSFSCLYILSQFVLFFHCGLLLSQIDPCI
uniref:Uncharacterized protein n=1 Tax=Amphilophus citrinellus TaxID=61819 RepID=A0A3Q0TDQ3_AMPCI